MKGIEFFPWTLVPEKRPDVTRANPEVAPAPHRVETPTRSEAISKQPVPDTKVDPHPENYIG